MNQNIKIAVIDTGINRAFIDQKKLRNELVVDENNDCREEDIETQAADRLHGMICALVIEKYCEDC